MKHILLLLVALSLLGCENIGKKKYTYINTSRSEFSGIRESEPKIIYAKTDSAAYVDALDWFEIEKDVAYNMQRGESGKYVSIPLSFTLEDSDGNYISFPEMKPTYKPTMSVNINEDEKKAFAGAEFGMNIKQIKSLPSFNNSDWSAYDNSINAYGHAIGNETYEVKLLFDNDELFCVVFSKYYENANYLDTDIKDQVENFAEVIKKAYGYPTNNYGFPSILRLEAGRISWAYKWEIGNKQINIGVEEKYSGSEYQMYAEILDTKRYEAIKAKKNNNKNEATTEAASQF